MEKEKEKKRQTKANKKQKKKEQTTTNSHENDRLKSRAQSAPPSTKIGKEKKSSPITKKAVKAGTRIVGNAKLGGHQKMPSFSDNLVLDRFANRLQKIFDLPAAYWNEEIVCSWNEKSTEERKQEDRTTDNRERYSAAQIIMRRNTIGTSFKQDKDKIQRGSEKASESSDSDFGECVEDKVIMSGVLVKEEGIIPVFPKCKNLLNKSLTTWRKYFFSFEKTEDGYYALLYKNVDQYETVSIYDSFEFRELIIETNAKKGRKNTTLPAVNFQDNKDWVGYKQICFVQLDTANMTSDDDDSRIFMPSGEELTKSFIRIYTKCGTIFHITSLDDPLEELLLEWWKHLSSAVKETFKSKGGKWETMQTKVEQQVDGFINSSYFEESLQCAKLIKRALCVHKGKKLDVRTLTPVHSGHLKIRVEGHHNTIGERGKLKVEWKKHYAILSKSFLLLYPVNDFSLLSYIPLKFCVIRKRNLRGVRKGWYIVLVLPFIIVHLKTDSGALTEWGKALTNVITKRQEGAILPLNESGEDKQNSNEKEHETAAKTSTEKLFDSNEIEVHESQYPSLEKVKIFLEISWRKGKKTKEMKYRIKKPKTTIGRDASNDIPLEIDPSVSRFHGQLEYDKKTVRYVDLGSRQGTKLNGKRVTTKKKLHIGDKLQIGKTTFILATKDKRFKPANSQV